jgi:hypothetical protein
LSFAYNISARTTQKTQFFYCCVWIRYRRDAFTAPLRSYNRGAGHKKHRSSVAATLLHSCLLLRGRVYGAVAQKQHWCIRLSRGRSIATALRATILIFSLGSSKEVVTALMHKCDKPLDSTEFYVPVYSGKFLIYLFFIYNSS